MIPPPSAALALLDARTPASNRKRQRGADRGSPGGPPVAFGMAPVAAMAPALSLSPSKGAPLPPHHQARMGTPARPQAFDGATAAFMPNAWAGSPPPAAVVAPLVNAAAAAAAAAAAKQQLAPPDSPDLMAYQHDPNEDYWWSPVGPASSEGEDSADEGGSSGEGRRRGSQGASQEQEFVDCCEEGQGECDHGGSQGEQQSAGLLGASPALTPESGCGLLATQEELEEEEEEEEELPDGWDEEEEDGRGRELVLSLPCFFPPGAPAGGAQYRLLRKLGEGAYASVYEAQDLTNNCGVAIKITIDHWTSRPLSSPGDAARYRVERGVRPKCWEEYRVYQKLKATGGGPSAAAAREHGIPSAFGAGTFELPTTGPSGTTLCSWIALQLLGPSMEGGIKGVPTAAQAPPGDAAAPGVMWGGDAEAMRALERVGKRSIMALSWVHAHGLVHRDIKPANLCGMYGWPSGDGRRVYLVDYGFAQPSNPAAHPCGPPCFYGTPLFAARAALRGGPPDPLDDLEGLLYSLLSMAAPAGPDGRRQRHALPFEVVRGKEADGGEWTAPLMRTWADRKERGWRWAADKGLIPPGLDRCYKYLSSLGPSDAINYAGLAAMMDGMGVTRSPPPPPPLPRRSARSADAAPVAAQLPFQSEWPFAAGNEADVTAAGAAAQPQQAAAQAVAGAKRGAAEVAAAGFAPAAKRVKGERGAAGPAEE